MISLLHLVIATTLFAAKVSSGSNDSKTVAQAALVAQWYKQSTSIGKVPSSNPGQSTKFSSDISPGGGTHATKVLVGALRSGCSTTWEDDNACCNTRYIERRWHWVTDAPLQSTNTSQQTCWKKIGITSAEIGIRSRAFEDSRNSRYYDKNRGTWESKEREPRNIEEDENTWRESSAEELAYATSSDGYTGYSDSGEHVNERESNRKSMGNGWRDAVPGNPGMDYPNYARIPVTSFTCVGKDSGGYYADVETGCQVFHVCNTGGVKSSFLCPPGSIFNQRYFVCDWWYSFNCNETLDLFNEKSEHNPEDSSPGSPDYPVYEKIESESVVAKNFKGTKNLDPLAVKYTKDGLIRDDNPTNDLSLGSSGERALGYSRQSSTRNDQLLVVEFKNNAHVHSSDSGASKSHENQVTGENAPRGFSRERDDDSLRGTKIDRDSNDFKNDLASYVNYAYFEAESSINDRDNNNNNKGKHEKNDSEEI